MEPLSEPTNTIWSFPFTPQDWAQTPPAVQAYLHTVHDASPAPKRHRPAQSRGETGPSRPWPRALTTYDRARGETRTVCVWEYDVDPRQAVLHASGT
jgi:hypothetical protein